MDLTVASQMRAPKDYAKKNGYSVVREYIDEVEGGFITDSCQSGYGFTFDSSIACMAVSWIASTGITLPRPEFS